MCYPAIQICDIYSGYRPTYCIICTIYYIYIYIYTMVSVQQMNLLPENAFQNDAIFAQKFIAPMYDHLAMLKFLGCIITIVYVHIYYVGYQTSL